MVQLTPHTTPQADIDQKPESPCAECTRGEYAGVKVRACTGCRNGAAIIASLCSPCRCSSFCRAASVASVVPAPSDGAGHRRFSTPAFASAGVGVCSVRERHLRPRSGPPEPVPRLRRRCAAAACSLAIVVCLLELRARRDTLCLRGKVEGYALSTHTAPRWHELRCC